MIFVGANLVRRCDGCSGNITINADRSVEQAQAPEARKRGGVEHDVVPATKLLVFFKAKTGVACPAVVFNFSHENWAVVCIECDQKDYRVEGIPRGTVTGRILRRNKESERVFKTVVEEFVVRSIVVIFQ